MAHRGFIMAVACWTDLAAAGPKGILARYAGDVPKASPSGRRAEP